jgi:hypothetical protein
LLLYRDEHKSIVTTDQQLGIMGEVRRTVVIVQQKSGRFVGLPKTYLAGRNVSVRLRLKSARANVSFTTVAPLSRQAVHHPSWPFAPAPANGCFVEAVPLA